MRFFGFKITELQYTESHYNVKVFEKRNITIKYINTIILHVIE